jgi:hypothetical protein
VSFKSQTDAWVNKATHMTDRQVQYICMSLMRDVVDGTPVDTGRARGNWQASTGSPITATLQAEDKNGRATINKGRPAAKDAAGNVFYLTNNLPYIYRLEFEGWSNQAPQGWVRTAVQRAKAIANNLPPA